MTTEREDEGLPDRVATLEETVDEVEATLTTVANRDLPLVIGTLRALMPDDVEAVAALPDAARALAERRADDRTRLEGLEDRMAALGDVSTEPSTKEEKMAAVLAFADNKRDPGQTTIAVTAPEIKGCVGVSRRYAYDLLEAIAAEVPGCRLRERSNRGGGTAAKPKAVLVDCEAVHEIGGDVNSFTTPRATTDGGTSAKTTQEVSE